MRSIFLWLKRDLWLLILSVLLSTTLWIIINNEQNPIRSSTIPGSIQVTVKGLPDNLTIVGSPPSVQVNVQARTDVLARLSVVDFHASVDASKVQPGQDVLELPVNVTTDNHQVTILGTIPDRVTLQVVALQTRTGVPVKPQILDTIGVGLLAGEPKLTPDTVNLTGTPDALNQVEQVIVEIRLAGHTTNINEQFEVKPINARGETVPDVKVTPKYVTVNIPVTQQLTQSSVPIIPETSGTVALGYGIVGYKVDPPQITIVGDPALLSHIQSVRTKPVDVTGAQKDTSVSVNVDLPPGIGLLRPQTVIVSVFINALDGQQIWHLVPRVTGLGNGLNASVAPGTVDVVLSGKMPVLQNLKPENIQVIVNATGLGPGSSTVPVLVTPPEGLHLDQLQPDKVTLNITPAPVPTPPPAPTPTVHNP